MYLAKIVLYVKTVITSGNVGIEMMESHEPQYAR